MREKQTHTLFFLKKEQKNTKKNKKKTPKRTKKNNSL